MFVLIAHLTQQWVGLSLSRVLVKGYCHKANITCFNKDDLKYQVHSLTIVIYTICKTVWYTDGNKRLCFTVFSGLVRQWVHVKWYIVSLFSSAKPYQRPQLPGSTVINGVLFSSKFQVKHSITCIILTYFSLLKGMYIRYVYYIINREKWLLITAECRPIWWKPSILTHMER